MTVEYFPDCDALVLYLAPQQVNSELSRALMDATGSGKEFHGHLLPGIDREFAGITSDSSLSSSVEFVVASVEKELKSNSKPILLSKLEKLRGDNFIPSRRVVLGELSPGINRLEKVDGVEFRKLAYALFYGFKQKREIIRAKLKKCDPMALGAFANREKTKVEELRNKLKELFPIKVSNDSKDNERIISAACQGSMISTPTHFVTADSLRRANKSNPQETFENMAEKARQAIKSLFASELKISRLYLFSFV